MLCAFFLSSVGNHNSKDSVKGIVNNSMLKQASEVRSPQIIIVHLFLFIYLLVADSS